jgi:hypothetical protein
MREGQSRTGKARLFLRHAVVVVIDGDDVLTVADRFRERSAELAMEGIGTT